MKKSFVFDVLFILLMVGVIACEEEIENVSLSNASVEEWSQASASFFAELTGPKKDPLKTLEYQFQTTHHLNKIDEAVASYEFVVFESGDIENFGLILSGKENQELRQHQILGAELENAVSEEEVIKLIKRDLNDRDFQIDFLKERIKMADKDPDLIRVVLNENSKSKEMKFKLFSKI